MKLSLPGSNGQLRQAPGHRCPPTGSAAAFSRAEPGIADRNAAAVARGGLDPDIVMEFHAA